MKGEEAATTVVKGSHETRVEQNHLASQRIRGQEVQTEGLFTVTYQRKDIQHRDWNDVQNPAGNLQKKNFHKTRLQGVKSWMSGAAKQISWYLW